MRTKTGAPESAGFNSSEFQTWLERLRLDVMSLFSSPAITGLLDISSSGAGQIKFPATQNASSNANTLDDYEEGTWTPTDGSGASLSFTTVSANYIKIGGTYWASFGLTFPATASGAGVQINGLPFTTGSTSDKTQGFIGYTDSTSAIRAITAVSGTNVQIFTGAGASTTNVQMTTNILRCQMGLQVF